MKAISAENDQDARYSNYRALHDEKYYMFKVYSIIKRLNRKYRFRNSLDVGCADGSFSAKLKKDFGLDTYGIDISKNAVGLAKKNGVKARVHNLDNELPFAGRYFDLVFGCEIIEHIYDTDFFIRELKRVLKKKGVLILTTPNLTSLVNRFRILFGKYPVYVPEYRIGGAGHVRAYTFSVLKKQLEANGLKVIHFASPNFTFPVTKKAPEFLKRIAVRLGDYLPTMGSHIIMVAVRTD